MILMSPEPVEDRALERRAAERQSKEQTYASCSPYGSQSLSTGHRHRELRPCRKAIRLFDRLTDRLEKRLLISHLKRLVSLSLQNAARFDDIRAFRKPRVTICWNPVERFDDIELSGSPS
ncbi:MAG: hypothetical protein AAGF95_33010 [Chloroflexota bacterium]